MDPQGLSTGTMANAETTERRQQGFRMSLGRVPRPSNTYASLPLIDSSTKTAPGDGFSAGAPETRTKPVGDAETVKGMSSGPKPDIGTIITSKTLDNPFLDQPPPRKLFKHAHKEDTSFFIRKRVPNTGDTGLHWSSSISSETGSDQPRLILTRVLPSNKAINANTANSSVPSTSTPALAIGATLTLSSFATSAVNTRGDSGRNEATIGDMTHKNDQRFAASTLLSSVNPAPSTTPKLPPKADYYKFLQDGLVNSDQHTCDESSVDSRSSHVRSPGKALGASIMAFARRSIMQHATTSPNTALKRISRVVAESNGRPSLTDLLTATDSKGAPQQPLQRPASGLGQKNAEVPKASFTFESAPLPSRNPSTSHELDSRHDILDVMDLGKYEEAVNVSASPSGDDVIRTDEGGDGTAKEGSTSSTGTSNNVPRSATVGYHEILSQLQQEQPFFNSKAPPRLSIGRKAIPYKTPTVNQRAMLQKSKEPGFRARPLDPKVFTSAGDLGVPRIRKQPLTIPVSPVFSRPRVKASTTTFTIPVKTAKLENITRSKVPRPPITYPATRVKEIDAQPSQEFIPGNATVATPKADRGNLISTNFNTSIRAECSSQSALTEKTPIEYPTIPNSRVIQESKFRTVFGLPIRSRKRNAIHGPPLREDSQHITTSKQSSDDRAVLSAKMKRPLTQPMPFKFATDELLRKRHLMFSNTGTNSVPIVERKAGGRVDKQTGAIRRPQPSLKRFTVPVPFHLATQRRAELHVHHHLDKDTDSYVHPTSAGMRSTSRLAGLKPLRSSFLPDSDSAANGPTELDGRTHFKPTVPISPKFGQRTQVRALQPSRFLLKKSTKPLTQPIEIHFHCDQRSKERDLFQQSVKKREQELVELRERSLRLNKATKPLTKPVSPMIGEKRKRHEMELRSNEEQQQQGEQVERRKSIIQYPENHPSVKLFPGDLETNGVREHHWDAQQQVIRQERRQLELANSSRATIRQPPIRLSFPLDLEESLHGVGDIDDQAGSFIDRPNDASVIPLTNDIMEGNNDNRLERELRRISLEANRGSGGLSKRLSDVANRSKSGRGNGTGGGRSSLEGGKVDVDTNIAGYYPFTRSHIPTSVSSHQ
ncbi:hypothetical protein BGX34_008071 [Mortierella sp. NVP85]|nr:hypothetical protein BGX34_008071 [Mortierella sp. NVP85]